MYFLVWLMWKYDKKDIYAVVSMNTNAFKLKEENKTKRGHLQMIFNFQANVGKMECGYLT